MPELTFLDWVAENYPDINLTTVQRQWAEGFSRGEHAIWSGGRKQGWKFLSNLAGEYVAEANTKAKDKP